MLAPALMIQGTASSVGKSILTAAFCRYFKQQGLRVLPFKSQNMALNASVTKDGGEIGRAQALQADACGVEAHVDMNPILLKPEGDSRSQVVVLGKSMGRMSAVEYHAYKPELKGIVADCLHRLRSQCDVLVIEGAGSPAEINLRARDIVNMFVAHAADASVLLVGDIDRGGVFASLVGTMDLLEPADRARVRGFLINKFRGDVSLLKPGLDFLEERTKVPTLGVIPHVPRLRVADEDSLGLDRQDRHQAPKAGTLAVAVIRYPRISNYDDFLPLEHEPGVSLRFVDDPAHLAGADLVILPGSKATVADLAWLRESGFEAVLKARAIFGEPIVGICGGCQMLGQFILDPDGVESTQRRVEGLGLLDHHTVFQNDKRTAQVRGRAIADTLLTRKGDVVAGYEIHAGRIVRGAGTGSVAGTGAIAAAGSGPAAALVAVTSRHGQPEDDLDGSVAKNGAVVGTMIHGIFDEVPVRRRLLESLAARRGGPAPTLAVQASKDEEFDRLAQVLEQAVSREKLFELLRRG